MSHPLWISQAVRCGLPGHEAFGGDGHHPHRKLSVLGGPCGRCRGGQTAGSPGGSPKAPAVLWPGRPLLSRGALPQAPQCLAPGFTSVSRRKIREFKKPLSAAAGAVGFQLLSGLVCASAGAFNNADRGSCPINY